jgi:hypothetical protein
LAVTSIGTATPTETAYGHIVSTATVEEVTSSNYDTEQIVRTYFQDIPVMIQIARCESTFRHTLEDGSVLTGRVDPADTGVMQINKRYHEKTAETMSLNLDDIYHKHGVCPGISMRHKVHNHGVLQHHAGVHRLR